MLVQRSKKRRNRIVSGTLQACCHQIEWWYDVPSRHVLSDENMQHLEEEAESRAREVIAQDCHSGDLCCVSVDGPNDRETEFFGW